MLPRTLYPSGSLESRDEVPIYTEVIFWLCEVIINGSLVINCGHYCHVSAGAVTGTDWLAAATPGTGSTLRGCPQALCTRGLCCVRAAVLTPQRGLCDTRARVGGAAAVRPAAQLQSAGGIEKKRNCRSARAPTRSKAPVSSVAAAALRESPARFAAAWCAIGSGRAVPPISNIPGSSGVRG